MRHAETAQDIFDELAKTPTPSSTAATTSTPGAHTPYVLERMLGLTGALCLAFFCMEMEGAHTEFLLQAMPYAMVLSITVGGLLASHGPHHMARMMRVTFGSSVRNEAEANALQSLCRRGRRLAYVGALLQTIASVVFFMSALDDLRLGQAVCEILAAFVFAMLLGELGFGSAEHWVKKPVSSLYS